MKETPIRILLLEEDPSEVQLLEEAFMEIEETRFARGWTQPLERAYALSLEEALHCLAFSTFDLILLDASLPDHPGLPAFRRIHAQAPQIPVIALCAEEDESLAVSLVREGAQDYLLKSEIDCAPLAHAIRCALERNRLLVAQQSISMQDDLTLLLNQRGLYQFGERYGSLAKEHQLQIMIVLMEMEGAAGGHDHDVALIQVSERLRGLFEPMDLVGRIGQCRFAAVMLASAEACLERKAAFLREQFSGLAALQMGWAAASAQSRADFESLLDMAEESLCENKLVENAQARLAASI
ncbi:MAG: response regulator [Acidimicrobiia bacterium]|nr:response regulator [Acidimicrobiia bacterium]